MQLTAAVAKALFLYFGSDVRRINHLMKVHGFAQTIGALEGLSENDQTLLSVAALMHDIGIKVSEVKHQSSAGHFQELEGPAEARKMLEPLALAQPKLSITPAMIDRVCFIIGHHHTYSAIDGLDFQILVEADFLVNADEDQMSPAALRSVRQKIFRTVSGTALLNSLYDLPAEGNP